MAPAAASGGSTLPSGFSVFVTFPDLLFIFEFDAAYHCVAALFYLSASVLEALATIMMYEGYTYKQYHENISAVVFAYVATLLYVVHAVFSLIRWKSS
ncbi:myelin and lymphocyte protein isoform X3 [Cricetulus griseus]|uniref:Myelin and lymphocyte protein n=1 Tax=Cricetulus griseus TaxID=10029 RepID=A0A8C2QIC1_CRIGR|nr:myelin and lymphocyte protein isoform X3 [Cricetulus griseus]XP_035301927.1 myelin and lymphocyte protein isoform X3 [Cricetulus griseus]ERE69869.1 myelin and lymphocyte protein-like isoform 2 [Cricetulus griseus]